MGISTWRSLPFAKRCPSSRCTLTVNSPPPHWKMSSWTSTWHTLQKVPNFWGESFALPLWSWRVEDSATLLLDLLSRFPQANQPSAKHHSPLEVSVSLILLERYAHRD